MITIRDGRTGAPLAHGPAALEIVKRCRTVAVRDVQVSVDDGQAVMTVHWDDSSTGTCDWRSASACLDWLRGQAWAKGRTTVRFPRRPAGALV